jgi:hypothetical protein
MDDPLAGMFSAHMICPNKYFFWFDFVYYFARFSPIHVFGFNDHDYN